MEHTRLVAAEMSGRKDFDQYSSIIGYGEKIITTQIQYDEHLYCRAQYEHLEREVR
jgi:hypothetical protein